MEVQRRLIIRILKALSCHQDSAEDGVLFLHKMNVAGRYHRNFQPLPQTDDGLVEVLQLCHRADGAVVHHKLIVANRLHLQVIVEGGNFEQVVKALARYHRAEQLTRFTGAAHQQSFPVADQLAFGNQRMLFKIF